MRGRRTSALLVALSLGPTAASAELSLHGFIEAAGGVRVVDNPTQAKDATLGESRLQLELAYEGPARSRLLIKTDFIGDGVEEVGEADLREAYLDLSPLEVLDLRVGRQVLTWGIGDLVFINDLFPKDFVSFYVGRGQEYLKAPSDAIKASLFPGPVSLDLVAIPLFTPSEVPRGDRLSFFDPFARSLAAPGQRLAIREPATTLGNTQLAARLYRTFGSYEAALYVFRGFFPEPAGMDPSRRELFFPKLSAYGSSLRGPLAGGVAGLEFGLSDSRQDRSGADPNIENSALKYLLSYERELWADLTVRAQYSVEQMLDFRAYRASLSAGDPQKKESRHLLFVRITHLARYQTVELSLVAFYSPSDEDAYLGPQVAYKVTDRWTVAAGANIFLGRKDSTPFGQLDANDNVYLRLRYSF